MAPAPGSADAFRQWGRRVIGGAAASTCQLTAAIRSRQRSMFL